MSETVTLTIEHKGKIQTITCRKGLGLQGIATKHQLPVEFDCRDADCGICIVTVLEGAEHLSPPTASEADFLKAMRAQPNERLGCQTRIFGSCHLRVEDFD